MSIQIYVNVYMPLFKCRCLNMSIFIYANVLMLISRLMFMVCCPAGILTLAVNMGSKRA